MKQVYFLLALILWVLLSDKAVGQDLPTTGQQTVQGKPYVSITAGFSIQKATKLFKAIFSKKKKSEVYQGEYSDGHSLNFSESFPYTPYVPNMVDYTNGGGGSGDSRIFDQNSGAGGGYGNNDNTYRIPGLASMPPQAPNSCVYQVIASVRSQLCGTQTGQYEVTQKYRALHPEQFPAINDLSASQIDKIFGFGVQSDHLTELAGSFLSARILDRPQWQLIGSIFSNNPVMVGFRNADGTGHNMLITGWNDRTQSFILLDPETGSETQKTYADVMGNSIYFVSLGCL